MRGNVATISGAMQRVGRVMRRVPVALVCLLAGALMPAAISAQVNAEQVLRIGRNVMSMKDYMLAISYLNQAIKAKPYLAEPYFLRAVAKINLEDYSGAEQDCSMAIERNSYEPDAYRLRGFCRLMLKQDSLALADLDRGLSLQPGDQWLMFYRAIALTENKNYEQADTAYRHLLKKFPKFDEAYTQAARMNYLRGDTVAALQALDSATNLTKDNSNNYLLRAQIFSEKKDWPAVAQNLNEAIRLEPDRADLYVNRATANYHADNFRGTMEDLSQALLLEPDNRGALYNRALLRLQVRDLNGALEDFSKVIARDPDNFHALYNRALINLDLHKYQNAISDFTRISKQYPRFYPLYYGIAQAQQALGQTDKAIRTAMYAEDMVRKYVANPRANPLDRPVIDTERTNSGGSARGEGEDDIDVMERYNQLVAVSATDDVDISFDDKIKGRVQDRELSVQPEDLFSLTLYDSRTTLRPVSNFFREIEDINNNRYLSHPIYISNRTSAPLAQARVDSLFELKRGYDSIIATGTKRPVDYLGRAVVLCSLRDYASAISDLDEAVRLNPRFTAAYMLRGVARHMQSEALQTPLSAVAALEDFDEAIRLNPRLIYAWFDKGAVAFQSGNTQEAIKAYTRAIEINPEFAEAYFNRAIAYISENNKTAAISDLSRAGQLGILPAYRLIKNLQ